MAQAQVGWNSLFSTSGKPFPWESGASLLFTDAGGRPGSPRYSCGGALVHCRAALTKAAKVRLGGALGVFSDGIGLFLDGYVLVPTGRENPSLQICNQLQNIVIALCISLNHGNRCNVKQH